MSVCELLLPAAEAALKMFLESSARSRGTAGVAEGERQGPPSQQAGLTTGFVSAPSGCREVQLLAEHLQAGTGPGSHPGQGAPAPGPPAVPAPRALAAGERLATAPCGTREARGGCCGPGTRGNQERCPQTFSLTGRHCKEHGTGHRCVIADRQGTKGHNREASARTKQLCFKPVHFLLLAAELKKPTMVLV